MIVEDPAGGKSKIGVRWRREGQRWEVPELTRTAHFFLSRITEARSLGGLLRRPAD
jgi:hypothetical protein